MKMTMHIDEALLDEVMRGYGFSTKTEAVDFALKELERRGRQERFMREGLGLSPDELEDGVYPDYDLAALRAAESAKVYGGKDPES